jgi:hypothetical protein
LKYCLILVLALSLPACARFSKSARQQRAYEKYVRKSMATRTRQQSQFFHSRAAKMPPSEPGPVIETSTQENLQAYPREQPDQ